MPVDPAEEPSFRGLRDSGIVTVTTLSFHQPTWPVQRRQVLKNVAYSKSNQVVATIVVAVPDGLFTGTNQHSIKLKKKKKKAFSPNLFQNRPAEHLTVQKYTLPAQLPATAHASSLHYLVHGVSGHLNTSGPLHWPAIPLSPHPHPHLVLITLLSHFCQT